MENTNRVYQEAGAFTLMFFRINPERTHYRLMNDRKGRTQAMRPQTWSVAKQMMPAQTQFFCVAAKTIPGSGKSGANFNIIGILSCYDTYEEAEEVSLFWRGRHKYMEGNEQKVAFTREFIQGLRDLHRERGTSCDFSEWTMNQFLELTR